MLFRIMLVSGGGTRREYIGGLNFEDAYHICENNQWEIDLGYIWDMEIEEDD